MLHLKSLELIGFKSFPEKTKFLFTDGITAIVGPNGCGKTNLLDALRWVLGEQKTSLLRGAKMDEVIFAGTRTLKPLGLAEVSLHIENRNNLLPTEYNEITVTRRLYRSGESEYLLNKQACRLKDITDLFVDTGIGAHAYSIIQQDMVDSLLSDKTEDRRFLFEEAAGITKYKHRKKAAERKLEATEHDLLRLNDILSEVTTQVNSLKRQVRKAERYKKVSDELKAWELFSARRKFDFLTAERKQINLRSQELQDRRSELDTQLSTRQAELEEKRTTLAGLDRELSEFSAKVYEVSEQGHRLEREISVNREKKENLKRTIESNREEISGLSQRSEAIFEERVRLEQRLTELGGQIRELDEQLNEAIEKQKQADREYLAYREAAGKEQQMLVDLEGRLSSGKTDSANIEEQIRELEADIAELDSHRGKLDAEKARRREEIAALQEKAESTGKEVLEKRKKLEDTEQRLNENNDEAERLRDRVSDLTVNLETTQTRLRLLSEMVEHHEGFGSGVVAVCDETERWPLVYGTAADFIRTENEHQAAIEAALGDNAQLIFCQTRTAAREAIAYLHESKAGRASFLILDELPQPPARPVKPLIEGFVGWAEEIISCEERFRPPLALLLNNIAVCSSLESAERALEHLPVTSTVVTLQGDVLTRQARISGGTSEESSLVGRKNEIEELGRLFQQLTDEAEHTRKEQAANSLRAAEIRQEVSRLTATIADMQESEAELKTSLKEEQFKINAADEVLTSIEKQIAQNQMKLDRCRHRQYELSLIFDQASQEKSSVASQVEESKSRLDRLEEDAQETGAEVNRLQVARVECDSKRSQAEAQMEHYRELLSDIADNINQREEQNHEAEQAISDLERKLSEDESGLKEIFDRRENMHEEEHSLRQNRDAVAEKVNGTEEAIREHRKAREALADELHGFDIQLTKVQSQLEQVTERIQSEYSLDISEAAAASPNPNLPEDNIAEHVETLREKLRRMGMVNLLALEEYEEKKSRQEFLSRQLTDLTSAKANLQTTIQKINRTAKALFVETLEKARENFREMYQELFTGGEADVYLENPDDPLESRIEIISRPRGKRPLTITQLSGGERALTAISLLFALYMVKPSPFCFLDEIDAPLDDVNVARFLTIVKKFSSQTQFIIITHNKITMEAADTLYGVTMEEPGVSKVVSVRFAKSGESKEGGSIVERHHISDNFIQAG